MSAFDIIAVLLFITAGFSYINCRYIRLPTSIGLMAISLVLSLTLVGASELGGFPALELFAERGFHGTAVPLVAKKAGVGAGTSGARHFGSGGPSR